ncbi:MAG: hypothetical protein A2286_00205 [Gammaproteobacteria bacterium RIFOXYA12_FULL_61_12]|nr:MAG: hypothetical protein A2286_00205 [Gammaproteobacteria bacterium RIFOXYA12_FULL_61_12]OGT91558.1 MAG: hypothetical protein A2514_12140 [Gammaproteobacteria bacterium RIFOXYD12_FULL_61_37]
MHAIKTSSIILSVFLATTVLATDFLRNPAEVRGLLNGKRLEGLYLRTQSAYSLSFRKDGSLVDQEGAQGRWWVNEQGQYCRKWETGKLQGHEACLDLALEGGKIAIYSGDKKVAEGALVAE